MARKVNFVVADNGIPYLLTARELVEGDAVKYDDGNGIVVSYEIPKSMTRSAVGKAMKGPKEFSFTYRYREESTEETGIRDLNLIRFGCTTFEGVHYRKLRKWALAGTKTKGKGK